MLPNIKALKKYKVQTNRWKWIPNMRNLFHDYLQKTHSIPQSITHYPYRYYKPKFQAWIALGYYNFINASYTQNTEKIIQLPVSSLDSKKAN